MKFKTFKSNMTMKWVSEHRKSPHIWLQRICKLQNVTAAIWKALKNSTENWFRIKSFYIVLIAKLTSAFNLLFF